MTCVLHGGEKLVLLKDKFMQEIERDPAFRLDDIHDLTKDQVRAPFKVAKDPPDWLYFYCLF